MMDSNDLERERGITILAKNTALFYHDTQINIVDTPGHSDFGGEVERALRMVDGVLLLVDASEGPLPQTRYVLQKALQAKLPPIVVLNKIDRPDARPAAVLDEIYDLFIDLDATEDQLDFPVLYTNAKTGVAHRRRSATSSTNLQPLFEAIVDVHSAALGRSRSRAADPGHQSRLQRLSRPHRHRPRLPGHAEARHRSRHRQAGRHDCNPRRSPSSSRSAASNATKPKQVSAGDIVAIAGVEGIQIGESITDPENPAPLEPLHDRRAHAGHGLHRQYLAVRRPRRPVGHLARPARAPAKRNCSPTSRLRVENTDTTESFRVLGRGELQLAILIETMRREGYELMVGKPEIVVRTENGRRLEPLEMLVIDCPETFIGIVMESLGTRRGEMAKMVNHHSGRVRMEFSIPSRGLIGLRGQLLTDTRGTALIHSILEGWTEYAGDMAMRLTGALVCDRPGVSTAYAIWGIQERGEMFIGPGIEVYEGMIVGENAREDDMDVNITKEKKQTNMRSSSADEAIRLIPPRDLTLEKAIEFIADDEYVEVTPKSIRLRKKVLDAKKRPKRWQEIRASAEASS